MRHISITVMFYLLVPRSKILFMYLFLSSGGVLSPRRRFSLGQKKETAGAKHPGSKEMTQSTDLFHVSSLHPDIISQIPAVNAVPILDDIIFDMSFIQPLNISIALLFCLHYNRLCFVENAHNTDLLNRLNAVHCFRGQYIQSFTAMLINF